MLKKILLASIFLCVVIGIGIFIETKTNISLLSPLGLPEPDYSYLIDKRISPVLNLNFSTTKELSSLDGVPRYMVFEESTGKVFYGKNYNDYLSPASITKLLTAAVAVDLIPLDTMITADHPSIDKVPTILELKAGEVLPAKELLRGAIATSANDAAQVLADGAAKEKGLKPATFIKLMNQKAAKYGMTHSQFKNPDGLDDQGQYSTLSDLAQLAHQVTTNYPEIIEAAKSNNQDIEKTDTHGKYYLPNWNGLVGNYPGLDGLKIGYTEIAGHSTIATAVREGKRMTALVSGTSSRTERDLAAANLLDAAFMAYGINPANVSKNALLKREAEWGALARKIRAEIKALQEATQSANPK